MEFRLDVKPEDILEVSQAVVAAKPHVVAEEGEQQRVGQGLGDDRQIDPGDPGAECKPAEDAGEHRGDEDRHQDREAEPIEAVPIPGQLLPAQEHHEIGQVRVAVDASGADLAHQVHAHGVTAQGEESGMSERENTGETPDQINRQGQHGKAEVLSGQGHDVGRHMNG